jgi:hypothetical protein
MSGAVSCWPHPSQNLASWRFPRPQRGHSITAAFTEPTLPGVNSDTKIPSPRAHLAIRSPLDCGPCRF